MKKKAIGACLFCLMFSVLPMAGEDSATREWFRASMEQANIFRAGTGPFQLEMDFTTQTKTLMQGHLTLKWAAPDRWWRKITLGDFHEIDVLSGEKLYIVRDLAYTPQRVHELESLIHVGSGSERLEVTKSKQPTERGTGWSCFAVRRIATGDKESHDLCFDAATRDLLSEERKLSSGVKERSQYSDYVEFQNRRYPRVLGHWSSGINTITARLASLESSPFNEALLTPPQGAIERRQCEGMIFPQPLQSPNPVYPEGARRNKLMGTSTFALTIRKDGSVDDIQLIGTAGNELDQAAFEAARKWKYKPAMCGNEPVEVDTVIEMSFRLH